MSNNIIFGGEDLILDSEGGIFWPEKNLLIVADLHLEKGSYFAYQGYPIPSYDTRDTLQRLKRLIIHYRAKSVICLGDNLHDFSAIERMQSKDYESLCELAQDTDFLWIIGNHDPAFSQHPLLQKFKFQKMKCINSLILSHDYSPNIDYQIIGHFHPKATIRIHSQTVKGKCFIVDSQVIIMPAFGSYTGGLNIASPVFNQFIDKNTAKIFLLKHNKIWPIPNI